MSVASLGGTEFLEDVEDQWWFLTAHSPWLSDVLPRDKVRGPIASLLEALGKKPDDRTTSKTFQ